jgi:hypothetical protein
VRREQRVAMQQPGECDLRGGDAVLCRDLDDLRVRRDGPRAAGEWWPSVAVWLVVMQQGCATLDRRTRGASIVGLAPPPSQARRAELADFLRQRRAQVTPERAGIELNGRRRTPGPRRQEVAQPAGVGLPWYTWLAQGEQRDLRLTQFVPADDATRAALRRFDRE